MSESNSFFTPQVITTIVIGAAAVVYYIYKSTTEDESAQSHYPQPQEPEKLERLPVGKLTREELAEFTGQNNSRILVSVCGRIYDLTRSRGFYGYPNGPYNCFAGADATYMLGALQLETQYRNKKDFEQDGDHQMTLSDWISKFNNKYPIVGICMEFADLAPESWREAGTHEINQEIDVNKIYDNDFRIITSEELVKCVDISSEHKWLSICGVVLDVKSAEDVYTSMYGDFPDAIGHDISKALIVNQFDKETYDQSIAIYKEDKQKLGKLKKYFKLFVETYPVIGFLQDKENKYRLNNLSDISEEWNIVDGNEVNPDRDDQKESTNVKSN